MNFDCVGRDSKGEMYMKFNKPFNPVEKIQLLQRSILVCSCAYYDLNDNLLSDYQYDTNAKQLVDLKRQYPEEWNRSRYAAYFHDFCDDENEGFTTSGYDLLERVKLQDKELSNVIYRDAMLALDQKRLKG